jgi:hypothetical protein
MKDDSLYVNLNAASRELDLLLEDLRVNPNRYFSVFGKKDKLPKLSDSDIERIQQAYQEKTKPWASAASFSSCCSRSELVVRAQLHAHPPQHPAGPR